MSVKTRPAPEGNKWGYTVQPEAFRKTGITYYIIGDICEVSNCGMYLYGAEYQERKWQACYYCKVKRYFVGIEADTEVEVWSGYSVLI